MKMLSRSHNSDLNEKNLDASSPWFAKKLILDLLNAIYIIPYIIINYIYFLYFS